MARAPELPGDRGRRRRAGTAACAAQTHAPSRAARASPDMQVTGEPCDLLTRVSHSDLLKLCEVVLTAC